MQEPHVGERENDGVRVAPRREVGQVDIELDFNRRGKEKKKMSKTKQNKKVTTEANKRNEQRTFVRGGKAQWNARDAAVEHGERWKRRDRGFGGTRGAQRGAQRLRARRRLGGARLTRRARPRPINVIVSHLRIRLRVRRRRRYGGGDPRVAPHDVLSRHSVR